MIREVPAKFLEWLAGTFPAQRQITLIDEYGSKIVYTITGETDEYFRVERPDFRFSDYNGIVPRVRRRIPKGDSRIVCIR